MTEQGVEMIWDVEFMNNCAAIGFAGPLRKCENLVSILSQMESTKPLSLLLMKLQIELYVRCGINVCFYNAHLLNKWEGGSPCIYDRSYRLQYSKKQVKQVSNRECNEDCTFINWHFLIS